MPLALLSLLPCCYGLADMSPLMILLVSIASLIIIAAVYFTVDEFIKVHAMYDETYTAVHRALSLDELDRLERDFKFFKSKHHSWPSHRRRAKDIQYLINTKKEDLKRYTKAKP